MFNLDQSRNQEVGSDHISLDPKLSSPPQTLLFYCPQRTHFLLNPSTLADPPSTQLLSQASRIMEMSEAIAVIGLDLRFPGDASTPESFYEMLQTGRSALSDIPGDRYNLDAFYHPDQDRAGAVSRHNPPATHADAFTD